VNSESSFSGYAFSAAYATHNCAADHECTYRCGHMWTRQRYAYEDGTDVLLLNTAGDKPFREHQKLPNILS